VWRDIIELTGGTGPLIDRARSHLDNGRALQALHLVDVVLADAPEEPAALRVKCRALEWLLDNSGRENFSEVQWLEQEIKNATTEDSNEA
jgi:hypothetical protein